MYVYFFYCKQTSTFSNAKQIFVFLWCLHVHLILLTEKAMFLPFICTRFVYLFEFFIFSLSFLFFYYLYFLLILFSQAFKYHALGHKKFVISTLKHNHRFKGRYEHTKAEWHSSWHGKYIKVSPNGKKAKKADSQAVVNPYNYGSTPNHWYSIALNKEGYS